MVIDPVVVRARLAQREAARTFNENFRPGIESRKGNLGSDLREVNGPDSPSV